MADQRRDRGSGSIRKISDKEYIARMRYYSTAAGKTRNKTKKCASEAEANRVLKAWAKELAQETYVDVKKESVQTFMTNWLELYKKPDLKPTSYDRLEYTLQHYIYPRIGQLQMGAISADTIQIMINMMSNDGLAFSTIKKVYDALNACFKWGVAGRKLQFNPMDAVTIPGAARQKKRAANKRKPLVKFFTQVQQDDLIAAAVAKYPNGTPIYRYGYAIPLLLNTGMRLGELLGLQWKRDVDLDNRIITIENSLVVVKNRDDNSSSKFVLLQQDSVKSEAGERKIYLNNEALDAMQHLYELTGQFTNVISSSQGKPIHPSEIQREFTTIKKRAGIPSDPGLGVHALRHSFATNLFRSHIDPKIISTLLGHSDIGVTMNIYAHVLEDQKQDALIMIGDRK